MKRYYLEVTPMLRDMYGTPRNAFGTTRYLIDAEKLQLPEIPEQFALIPFIQTVRGLRGGEEFSIQFQVRFTDADVPQPQLQAPFNVTFETSKDRIAREATERPQETDKVVTDPEGFRTVILNALYGKDRDEPR